MLNLIGCFVAFSEKFIAIYQYELRFLTFFQIFRSDLRLIKNKPKIVKFREITHLKYMGKMGVVQNLQKYLRIATKNLKKS